MAPQVLDVDNVDLVMGKVMDEGPVLAVSFQSQQIMCLRNNKGEVSVSAPSRPDMPRHPTVLSRQVVKYFVTYFFGCLLEIF